MKKITFLFTILLTCMSFGVASAQCEAPTLSVTITGEETATVDLSHPTMGNTYGVLEGRAIKTALYNPASPNDNTDNFQFANPNPNGANADVETASFSFVDLTPGTDYTFVILYQCTGDAAFLRTTATGTTNGTAPVNNDAWSFNISPNEFVQASSYDIPVTYTSDLPIQPGGITIEMRCTTENPFSNQIVGTYSNTAELPAGTDLSATITANNFAAQFTISDTDGGISFYDTAAPGSTGPANQLLEANPNGVTVEAATIAYFFFRPLDSTDDDFDPVLPGNSFTDFIEDPSLSVSEFTKGDISNLITSANPVASTIKLNAEGSYSIVNISGQTVQAGDFNSSISVETLKTGLYFLSIEEGTYKFVKK